MGPSSEGFVSSLSRGNFLRIRLGLCLLLGALIPCGGESTKNTGSAATTGGTDGGDDGGEVTTGEGLFPVKNCCDANGVADAEVTSSLGSVPTDTDGDGTVLVPLGGTFEGTIHHPSFFPVRFFGALPAGPVDRTFVFVAEEFLVAAIVADQPANLDGQREVAGELAAASITRTSVICWPE